MNNAIKTDIHESSNNVLINADEAKKLKHDDEKEYLEYIQFINERIKLAAVNDNYVIIRQLPYARWLDFGFERSKAANRVLQELSGKGFVYSFFYEEKQFVDMGLKICW